MVQAAERAKACAKARAGWRQRWMALAVAGLALTVSGCMATGGAQDTVAQSAPVSVDRPLRTVPADQVSAAESAADQAVAPVEIASTAGAEPVRSPVMPPASDSRPAAIAADAWAVPSEPSATALPVASINPPPGLDQAAALDTPPAQVANGQTIFDKDDASATEPAMDSTTGTPRRGDPNAGPGPNSPLRPDPPEDFRDFRQPGRDFDKAIEQIYLFNPTIRAARRELSGINENVNIARAGRLPTASANAIISPVQTYTVTDENIVPEPDDQVVFNTSFALRATINQVLWSGGRVRSAIEQAEAQVIAQRATLFNVEQQVVLNGALAFLDVARDQRIYSLNENNIEVLDRQRQATQDRFDVGEATISEIEQARARVERARGDAATALATLRTSRATYYQFVETYPDENLDLPQIGVELPGSLEAAIEKAEINNPGVLAAEALYAAAIAGIDVAFAELLPFLDLTGTATYTFEPANRLDSSRQLSADVTLTIPIFSGGRNYASLRQTKFTANQRLIEVEEAKRSARQQAEAGWETYRSTLTVIEARKAEVDAAQVALEGIREEWRVGSRPLLDVLDAEQDLLNAQVALTTAERDNLAAILQLVAAVGDMDPDSLQLNIATYNPVPAFENTRNKLIDLGVE